MEIKEKEEKLNKKNIYTGFGVLFKYLSIYKKTIIILSIMGVLSAIGNGVIPYISGKFFDSILSPESYQFLGFNLPLFFWILVIWSIVQCITYVIDWRNTLTSEYISNVIWLDYLSNGFGFLLNLPISFHKKNKIGEIGSMINMAAGSLERIVGRTVIDVAPQILSIVIALSIALYLKPILALILLVGLIVFIFVLANKVKPLAGHQKAYFDSVNELYGDAFDSIHNAHAIKQATSEKYENEKLTKKTRNALPLWMNLTKVWGNLSLYQKFIILITQILIFSVSIYYIRNGSMTIGELMAFNAYAAMIFGPFVVIARNWQDIQNGIINIQKTEDILNMDPENYEPENAVSMDFRGDIDFKNVFFNYDKDKIVLQDISFSVKAGEIIALVGESGVGKSTLVDLISGYHFANSGEVLIDGHDIRKINLRTLRSQIAIVPQEVVLFNDTIRVNIKYGNFHATDDEMMSASKKAHALDFIEKFTDKWEQIVGERGVKLSVGQKQRVAIARAILRNPKILILDEPTSALDAGSEHIITKSLEELMHGKTTFIIAHRLSTVRKADKILVFKEGKIIETGTHDELIKIDGGEYKRLYDLQIGLTG